MSVHTPILTSFNGGELSPRMGGRVDTQIYAIGLESCENFVPTVEGPIVKRPGFEYITAGAASASWLSTFKFSLTQEYAIEWSEGKLRFFTNGARIETSPGVPYEVSVPYTAAQAPFVWFQQSYDRLYLVHPAHPPAALLRTSATTFSYAPLELKNGPFTDTNADSAVTVTASATSGNGITITASAPIFLPGHVGALLRIEAQDFSDITAWEAGLDGVTVGQVRRSDGKAYTAATAGRTGTVQPIHTQGTEWDGSNVGQDVNGKPSAGAYGVKWTYRHDKFGIVKITAIGGGGTTATVDVIRRLPDSVTTVATFRWAHALFSAAKGWPNVVKLWAGRLTFFKEFDIVGSVAGDYGGGSVNFATFTSSGLLIGDLAFRRTIATEDPVLWAAGDRKLIAGTASRELAIGAINASAAISGDNIAAEPQSFYGSERVWPAQLGTSTFFVQRGGRKLREAQYDFARDRYVAANATVWCRHITHSGVIQYAFQKEPEELLFAVRGDGQMIAHPHQPEQDIKGFSRIRHSDGAAKILSAVSIVAADGKTDEVWALVERAGAKSVERMAAWRDDGDPIEMAFFVDSGVRAIAAANQTHFSGATHLANQTVAVLAGGGVVPGIEVAADGSFDIPATAAPTEPYIIAVGLPFTATAVTLRPELKVNGNTSQAKRQRLVRIALRLLDTIGIRVGAFGGILDQLIDRPADADMDAPVPLYNGDSNKAVSGGWDKSGRATFVSEDPVPAVIVAAMPEIDLSDK
ncbi:hypothetical protein [Sphingomonas sp. LaA6.9]|uniref:hypothetical protein n=1 Tax=Sphingomonas sp. LaA6.9 TaxID=2919914 RepID=UPI001F4FCC09|nr:hypothetical protein [Sphingomonas sp. LaA6.9]MCJ8159858.1 hypothetical protein [Sphingomonas sp. LaA6.9]